MRSDIARRLLALLLVAVGIYRFSLLGRGALAFVDETFYFTSVKALQSLSSGDLHSAVADIAAARGRNGAALLQMPVAALQAIPARYGIPASNLRSLLLPTACNVIVTLISLYFVFGIGVVLCGSAGAALAGAFVYALLANSNIYVRHLLPYDWALCVGLLALWLAITRQNSRGLAVWTGLLTGVLLTVYTGYYSLCAVIGLAVLWQAWSSRALRDAFKFTLVFALSAAAAIAAVELLFRTGGQSYFGSLRGVHRDISFTSYGDGWTFLPDYLLDVERLAGLALILGAVAYVWRAGVRIVHGRVRPIDRVMLTMLAAFVVQAASSSALHAIPLYGRLIHPWMPFLVWMLADSLTAAPGRRARAVAYTGVLAASVISFGLMNREYWPLKYPPDVLYAMGIDTEHLSPDHMLCELYPGTSYSSPGPVNRTTREPFTDRRDYVLLNFCQALPAVPRPKQPAVVPSGATRVFDGPHWMTFPAYAYEGLSREDREAIRRDAYRLQVFTTHEALSSRPVLRGSS
ncbi:MAG TPA: hypothetical protein VLV86_16385 [Vicinamibacterales bacterium]|nr:hypothetical protein [Vicinamibacterales bacterium]